MHIIHKYKIHFLHFQLSHLILKLSAIPCIFETAAQTIVQVVPGSGDMQFTLRS